MTEIIWNPPMPFNIMILQAEDTGRSQGCYGNPAAHTPAIDQLAAEGVRYTHAFSTAPVCAPSRSTMVTGQYAWSYGAHHMRSNVLSPPTLFTERLRAAGYYVNWSNKTDFNFEPPATFADDRHDWFGDLASGKLKGRPWLLYHNCFETHESYMWSERYLHEIQPQLAPDPPCDPASVEVPPYLADTPEIQTEIARHYDALRLQDRIIDRALRALDASGERDNTLVIYLSDHGRGLIREKRWCYEAGIHLPLILRWPGVLPAGVEESRLVSWVDLAPTLLAAAGIDSPDGNPGRIFAGPSTQTQTLPREFIVAGRDRMDEAFDRVRILRSQNFLYIRNDFPQIPYAQRLRFMERQQSTRVMRERNTQKTLTPEQSQWFAEHKPPEELYDCRTDPHNVKNLAGDPAYQEQLIWHRDQLQRELNTYGDLGEVSEPTLISQGIVGDKLTEYARRIQPLPRRWHLGPDRGPLTPHLTPHLTPQDL